MLCVTSQSTGWTLQIITCSEFGSQKLAWVGCNYKAILLLWRCCPPLPGKSRSHVPSGCSWTVCFEGCWSLSCVEFLGCGPSQWSPLRALRCCSHLEWAIIGGTCDPRCAGSIRNRPLPLTSLKAVSGRLESDLVPGSRGLTLWLTRAFRFLMWVCRS